MRGTGNDRDFSAGRSPPSIANDRGDAEFKVEDGDLLTSVVVKLTAPDPYDLTDIDLSEYKGIVAPWNTWRAVQEQCATLAAALMVPPTVIYRQSISCILVRLRQRFRHPGTPRLLGRNPHIE
jgi:hypothetical protein